MNLHSYDAAAMWNEDFKLQLDQPHSLAAILDLKFNVFSETAEQIEEKLCRCDRLSMTNKKFPPFFVVGHMVWQPHLIEGKY